MEHLRFKSEQTAAAYVAGGLDPIVQEQFELHLMSCPECVDEVESWRALKGCLRLEAGQSQVARGGMDGRAVAPSVRSSSSPGTRSAPVTPAAPAAPASPAAPTASTAAVGSATRASPASPTAPPPAAAPLAAQGTPGMAATASRQAAASAAGRWRVAAALAAGVVAGAAGGWFGRAEQGPSIRSQSIGFYSLPPLMRGPSDCTSVRMDPHVTVLALRVPGAATEQRLVAVDSEGRDLASEDYSAVTQTDGSWLVRLRAETLRDQGIRFEARSADGTVEPRGCVLASTQS